MFKSDLLKELPHGFLTRRGGVSKEPFSSLNFALTKGDPLENIIENRKRALELIGVSHRDLVISHQVHGSDVVVVDQPWRIGVDKAPQADALVTTQTNIVLGVLTADCVPILLADRGNGVIGVAHAGWRGLKKGVVHAVVHTMQAQGAQKERIVAVTGPCIQQNSYEVGQEVYEEFSGFEEYFQPVGDPRKYLFDIEGLAKKKLKQAGIQAAESLAQDTYSQSDLFFSCRRSAHNHEPVFGCQASIIGL